MHAEKLFPSLPLLVQIGLPIFVFTAGQCFQFSFFFTSVQAFCETLEESNYRLQKELLEKQKEIASLKRRLQEREKAILLLEKHIKSVDVVDTRTTQEMGIRVGKKSNAPKKNELYKQPRAAS